MSFDVPAIRAQFPALKETVNGLPVIHFDGPGGTQMPQRVIDRMVKYLVSGNSNTGGVFHKSIATDAMIASARETFADFFNCSADEIAFCQNSTTISFKLAEAIARDLKPGDEILLTDMDHEANRGPWELLAERGLNVQSVRVNRETCTLDMDDLGRKLTRRTKVFAFNHASNAVGTISDAKALAAKARAVGAITIVDAVHYALHGVVDVRDLGVDYLFCSAYKFFGPHVGVLYARRDAMEALRTLRVGAQKNEAPFKFETGTLNHEGIAGAAEAVEFLASVGEGSRGEEELHEARPVGARRRKIIRGVLRMEEHEQPLAAQLREELRRIPGLEMHAPPPGHPCTSTISFRLRNVTPRETAKRLAEKGVCTWAGNFYAIPLSKALGYNETGLVRIGLAPYNTAREIEFTLDQIRKIAAG
ncbi:cysteine desulfurase-like protein [Candidatus Sumerlaeota bacterium]|nr:cysteine desulfurase-like protein [Candidatus Sumerlaeota bacterium]